MMIYDWLFGKKCCVCKLNKQEKNKELFSELSLLKTKCNDLEMDNVELEYSCTSLISRYEYLKTKNDELISILLNISDIAKNGVESVK